VDEFGGQQADVIGFVYSDIRFKDQPRFMVARFTISCCVADASAIGVIVESTDAAKLAPDSWIHVTGKFKVEDLDGQKTPVLIADKIDATKQPDQPYLYP
jgi:putative membrane protein